MGSVVYSQGRRLGVLGGANDPPKKFFAPPKDSLGGGQNKLSFRYIIYGKINLFCPPKEFLGGGGKIFIGGAFAPPQDTQTTSL